MIVNVEIVFCRSYRIVCRRSVHWKTFVMNRVFRGVNTFGISKYCLDLPEANAVAACIFKGLPGGGGSAPTPPICGESGAEVKYAEYFEKFFEVGGKYLQYIVQTNDADPAGADRLKIKKGYKVAIYAQVSYDALRRELEANGIARRLDSRF